MPTNTTQTKPSIGFIGMGHMGILMAQRLLQAGYQLTVYDRTSEKTHNVAQHGACVVDSPRALAAGSDVVISCVADNHALESVMQGPEGALAGARAETIFIEMSTVYPQESRHIFEAAKAKGACMIDAAISGSTSHAQEGSLLLFVGGEQEIYQRCKPILDVLAKATFYMGGSGMGTTMKLVVNSLLGLGLQAVAEAMALGEKAGLQKKLLLEVLSQTAVISPAQREKLEKRLSERLPGTFCSLNDAQRFEPDYAPGCQNSVPMPATAIAEQMYTAALAQGRDADYSVILQFMEALAGLLTRHGKT